MASFSNLGANVGLALGSLWPTLLMPADQVHLVYPLADKMVYLLQETGYLHLQVTTGSLAPDPTVSNVGYCGAIYWPLRKLRTENALL